MEATGTAMTALSTNPQILMLLMIGIYLILGCFIEGTAIMYMALPIFMPLLAQMGTNYIQFGVVTVLALMIGMITPPVGVCSRYGLDRFSQVDSRSGTRIGRARTRRDHGLPDARLIVPGASSDSSSQRKLPARLPGALDAGCLSASRRSSMIWSSHAARKRPPSNLVKWPCPARHR
jgi:hypothetical protein